MDIEKIKEELIRRGFNELDNRHYNESKKRKGELNVPLYFVYKRDSRNKEEIPFKSSGQVIIGNQTIYVDYTVRIHDNTLQFISRYRKTIYDKDEHALYSRCISDYFETDNENDLWLAIENSEKFIENEEIDN